MNLTHAFLGIALAATAVALAPTSSADVMVPACPQVLLQPQVCTVSVCDNQHLELCDTCGGGSCEPFCGFQLQDCRDACDGGVSPCLDYLVCEELTDGSLCATCMSEGCDPCWWEPALCSGGCDFQSCEPFPWCEGIRERVCDLLRDCRFLSICAAPCPQTLIAARGLACT